MRPIKYHSQSKPGVTLIELVIAAVMAVIVALTVGVLLLAGHKQWRQSYAMAHKEIKEDSDTLMIRFGILGRHANRSSYEIYSVSGNSFGPAEISADNPNIHHGDAVEFRYWDTTITADNAGELLNPLNQGNVYALLYLEDDRMMVDYGTDPPAVAVGGGARKEPSLGTRVLARNVFVTGGLRPFSHTMQGGRGRGSVRLNVVLVDPNDERQIQTMTTCLLRNQWP